MVSTFFCHTSDSHPRWSLPPGTVNHLIHSLAKLLHVAYITSWPWNCTRLVSEFSVSQTIRSARHHLPPAIKPLFTRPAQCKSNNFLKTSQTPLNLTRRRNIAYGKSILRTRMGLSSRRARSSKTSATKPKSTSKFSNQATACSRTSSFRTKKRLRSNL